MPLIERISGAPASFGLRHRVFNLFLFFGGIAGFASLFLRILFQQHIDQMMFSVLITVTFIISYSIARVKRIFSNLVVLISAVFILIILGFSFFYNSGTDGKVIPLVLLSLTIYILIIRKDFVYFIAFLHILTLVTILTLQYLHPEWVIKYPNEEERFIDNIANVIYIVSIMYFILVVIRREFEKEREKIRKKDDYLNQQNQLIEDLLKELNHRVKNNLQVVSALLSLQAYRSRNPAAISALEEGKNRLISMSLLHKKLYQDNFFNQISLAEYIDDLIDHVLPGVGDIKIKKDIEDIMLTADQAIPLGLILNEIFTLIRDHTFEPMDTSRIIEINSKLDKPLIKISIKDNSGGSLTDSLMEKKSAISIELIDMLIKQLDGIFEVLTIDPQGTELRIKFTLKY